MQEALAAAIAESGVRHIYLVGGSMTDWAQEGERYIELARAVQAVNEHRIPVACGPGALPDDRLEVLHRDGTVDFVCMNLELWSEPLFAKICPGKQRYVGYRAGSSPLSGQSRSGAGGGSIRRWWRGSSWSPSTA
jgi:hypothetical protein